MGQCIEYLLHVGAFQVSCGLRMTISGMSNDTFYERLPAFRFVADLCTYFFKLYAQPTTLLIPIHVFLGRVPLVAPLDSTLHDCCARNRHVRPPPATATGIDETLCHPAHASQMICAGCHPPMPFASSSSS